MSELLGRLPVCSIGCITNGIARTSCQISDLGCVCTTGLSGVITYAEPCVNRNCTIADADSKTGLYEHFKIVLSGTKEVFPIAAEICKDVGVSSVPFVITTSASIPSSATTSTTSNTSVSATITPSGNITVSSDTPSGTSSGPTTTSTSSASRISFKAFGFGYVATLLTVYACG